MPPHPAPPPTPSPPVLNGPRPATKPPHPAPSSPRPHPRHPRRRAGALIGPEAGAQGGPEQRNAGLWEAGRGSRPPSQSPPTRNATSPATRTPHPAPSPPSAHPRRSRRHADALIGPEAGARGRPGQRNAGQREAGRGLRPPSQSTPVPNGPSPATRPPHPAPSSPRPPPTSLARHTDALIGPEAGAQGGPGQPSACCRLWRRHRPSGTGRAGDEASASGAITAKRPTRAASVAVPVR